MGYVGRQFVGWRIAEAMRRCADPDLLSAWFRDYRVWHKAGRPNARSYYSSNGYSSRYDPYAMKIIDRRNESYARLHKSLIEHLFAERIIAWGRRDTPTADPKAIPGSAWKYLRIPDIRNPVVREPAPTRTKIYDVRIFPIIESPDAIDRLEDRTFAEAFHMSVVDDPQLKALRKRAIAGEGAPASFGNEWYPHRAVWPVVLSEGSNGEPAIEIVEKVDAPTIVKAANRIRRQRYAKLISYLSTGRLGAEGVPAAGRMRTAVPRSIWLQDRTYIDVEAGDLLVAASRAKDPINRPPKILFTGLILRTAESIHRISEIPLVEVRPAANRKVPKSIKNVRTKTTSRDACRNWLVEIMSASPTVKLGVNDDYWRQAHSKWPRSLSERSFLGVWSEAVTETKAYAWSAGGRPKKPPQAKPPHQ